MNKLWIILAVLATFGGIGWGAKYYYDTTQSTISILTEQKTVAETANEGLLETVNELVSNIEEQKILMMELNKSNAQHENDLFALRQLLTEHDLTRLAAEKPGLIERKINDSTSEIFRTIESDTALPE